MLLTTPDFWLIDVARAIAVATGIVIIVLAVLLAVHPSNQSLPGDDDWALGSACWGLFAVIQESTQFGHRFLIWRLPLLLVGNFLILRGIAKRAKAGRHL